MKKFNYDEITKTVKRKAMEVQLHTLMEVANAILDRVNARATVMYSETGEEIRANMKGERHIRALTRRRTLFKMNNEDFMIVGMIQRMQDEIIRELKK